MIKNGVWYPSGSEVPDGAAAPKTENVENPQYTKTDINRMSTAELKELATKQGVENVEDMTGSDLKKVLIEKFGL